MLMNFESRLTYASHVKIAIGRALAEMVEGRRPREEDAALKPRCKWHSV
jgi:hypothetical protein